MVFASALSITSEQLERNSSKGKSSSEGRELEKLASGVEAGAAGDATASSSMSGQFNWVRFAGLSATKLPRPT